MGVVYSAVAQPTSDPEAEALFHSALTSFEAEEYLQAYRGFYSVYERTPEHIKTTAALLMAGKALFRLGDYMSCIDLLDEFKRKYSTSSYLQEAERILEYARLELRKADIQSNAVRIGVVLPFFGSNRDLTQSLFNGIRLAVEEHNSRGGSFVQLIFKDTQHTAGGARAAVAALIAEGVTAIIGPLFSQEVLAAARVAERAGVVMVAPMATDADITRGRSYVFQVNATLEDRGRYMARTAMNDLGLSTFGVVAEGGNHISMAMARGFMEEATRLGATVVFNEVLPSSTDWLRLPEIVGDEQLYGLEAMYLSVHRGSEQDVARVVQGILPRLGRIPSPPHILGASAWHEVDLGVFSERLSVSYVDVFHVSDLNNDVRNFRQAYRRLSRGATPGRLAYVGYDVARVLLQHVGGREALASRLRGAPLYTGLATRIHFDERQRNASLFLFHHSPNGGVLAN